MKKLIAILICYFCKIFKIYVMVNMRLESKDATLTSLTNGGTVKYCEFAGKTTYSMEE